MAPEPSRGPRAPLTPERRALAGRYLAYARSLARPLKRNWPRSGDDFESAATYALVEAAEAYDPGRNVPFPAFARRRILGALRDVQRDQVPRGWRGSGPAGTPEIEPLPATPEEEAERLGHLAQPPVGRDLEAVEEVERWLQRLPPRYADACREIYLNGRSFDETARILGSTYAHVHRLHSRALAMLARRDDAPTIA